MSVQNNNFSKHKCWRKRLPKYLDHAALAVFSEIKKVQFNYRQKKFPEKLKPNLLEIFSHEEMQKKSPEWKNLKNKIFSNEMHYFFILWALRIIYIIMNMMIFII